MNIWKWLRVTVIESGHITTVDILIGRWALTFGCPSRLLGMLSWRPEFLCGGSRYGHWASLGVAGFSVSAYRDGRQPHT